MSSACRTLRLHALVIRAACCVLLFTAGYAFAFGQEAKKEPAATSPVEAKPVAAAPAVESKPTAAAPVEAKDDVKPAAAPAATEAKPAAAPATSKSAPATIKPAADTKSAFAPAADGRLTFSFRYQPWQDVLDWFAEQAGLSLVMESAPSGTFNYNDTRSYTPKEALDIINGVLLTKGYTLVRHDKMLIVVNLEDGVPPNLVPDVLLADLDSRGEYELVRVLFPVWNMTPDQAAEEVQPLLGPQGKVVVLPQGRQIQVTEVGGRLRTIRSVINAVEQPDLGKASKAGMREFEFKYLTFETAMPTIRQMLGIPAEAFSTPDGSVQITKSATGNKMLFRGNGQQASRLAEILRLVDVPEAAQGVNGAPQLEVYAVTTADPETVVKVLQTLMRGDPNVVLTADKDAGHVVAFATPPQQATIRATIDQMQKDGKSIDVIGLSNVDPQVAVLAINKLFGSTGDEPDPKAPRVDADITTRSLLVRGTASQVAQIRDLLHKLGENEEEGGGASNRQHVRLLPLSGAAARSAISQIEQIWPSVRQNRIRIVTPTSGIPSYRPGDTTGGRNAVDAGPAPMPLPAVGPSNSAPADGATDQLQDLYRSFLKDREAPQTVPQVAPVKPDGANMENENDRAADAAPASVFKLVAGGVATTAADPQAAKKKPAPTESKAPTTSKPGAPVVVAPGPGGTLIASDDLEALDELEDLLTTVVGHNAASGREYAVFYLKYSKAATIAEVLNAIFGGGGGGKDRGIIGDLASNALGDVGGGLMGDLLLGGGGGGSFSSGAVDIVPDARLNALIVHAKSTDLDTVEQLLKVLDQHTGPEDVEAEARPRAIPVYNTTASDMAQIVQQVYQDRMASAGGVMSPQDMMKMIRGGNNAEQQVPKMSVAVDSRNNMLIVRAPDPLFEEVKAFVEEQDQAGDDSPQTTKVVSLKHTNSSAVQKALTSILGNVKTNTTTAQSTEAPRTESSRGGEDSPEDRMRQQMRRNWEMMQEMRRATERSGGGGGDDRSRFFRGGPGGPGGPGGGDFRGRGGDGGRDGGRGGDRGGDRGR
jgi:type II secretory pathway component GspD/PulD (secretin)